MPRFRILALLVVLACSGLARASDFAEDAKIAMPMLLKALTYDVNFDARGLGDFTVLVVGDPSQPEKRDLLMGALKDLSSQKVKNRPLKYTYTDFKDEIVGSEIDAFPELGGTVNRDQYRKKPFASRFGSRVRQ